MKADSNLSMKLAFSLLFAIFLMPVSIFYLGYQYYLNSTMDLEKSRLVSFAEPISGRLNGYLKNDQYWCRQLNSFFSSCKSSSELHMRIEMLSHEHKQKLGWVIWNKQGTISKSINLANKASYEKWKKLGEIVRVGIFTPSHELSADRDYFLRRFIGPHLQAKRFGNPQKPINPHLLESDFNLVNPLVWAEANDDFTVMVLFPPAVSQKKHGIKKIYQELLRDKENHEIFFLTAKNELITNGQITKQNLNFLRKKFLNHAGKVIFLDGKYFYGEYFSNGFFFMLARRLDSPPPGKATALFALALAFTYLILFKTISVEKFSSSLKVKQAIFIFIGCSNILPLIILGFFAKQYLAQKYLVMIDEKRAESVKFIQLMEQEFSNQMDRFSLRTVKTVNSFKKALLKGPLNLAVSRQMSKEFIKQHLVYNFIASQSLPIFSHEGFLSREIYVPQNTGKLENQSNDKRLLDITGKIGGSFLSFWNKTPISQNALTETELLADLLFQKPIDESLHMLIEIKDQIGFFGFGTTALPSFAHVVSLHEPEKGDYLGIFQYGVEKCATEFLLDRKKHRLANEYGLKIIFARSLLLRPYEIAPFENRNELLQVFSRLKNSPPINAEIIDLEKQKWICTGYLSGIFPDHYIVALYPLVEIDRKLRAEAYDLLMMLLFNLLIVFAISFFFSLMLLVPIKLLIQGTKAIDARDFSHRLPNLGNDEFGHMAHVFNEAISDLEELSIARVVQQQLFPTAKIDTGNFNLCGKTVTLADLGGDYLDYFTIDNDNFAVILGDVAGHGVGAAMIMAIAKSATINSQDYFKTPVKLIERLHNLIYSTKTKKQKKIMTFQYLCVNKNNRVATFANAGGCNPFMVNGTQGKVEEIILPAAALGAFKKGKFSEKEIQFQPGDVMVLYSDGIVEARNTKGEEIGYPRFKEILLKHWNTDTERFYQNVLSEYHQWLGSEPAQDDLTLIFMGLPE